MPLYRIAVPPGATTETQRADIAQAVVAVHCGVTGAPPSFVHAFFAEVAPVGSVSVRGSIRWGRTDEQKSEIVGRLSRHVRETLAVNSVDVTLVDVPSRWNMEGGELLPEPGEEAAWLERHTSGH